MSSINFIFVCVAQFALLTLVQVVARLAAFEMVKVDRISEEHFIFSNLYIFIFLGGIHTSMYVVYF